MAADSPAERAHWRSVLKAYDGYMQYHVSTLSANHARRMSFLSLNKEHKEIYEHLGYRDKLDAVDEGIRRNAEFLDEMISDPVFAEMLAEPEEAAEPAADDEQDEEVGEGAAGHGYGIDADEGVSSSHTHDHGHDHAHANGQSSSAHSHSHSHSIVDATGPESSKPTRHEAQDKVRSTLRSFVRDWSALGSSEREACYTPCLRALQDHWASKNDIETGMGGAEGREKGEFRVLVPGCGLGRLAMEVAALGFESQANEFSTYMLLASNWVLNHVANSHAIHPFLHSFSNHLSTANLLRAVPIPDTCPRDVLGNGEGGGFSLVAGDFEEIYGEALEEADLTQRGQWGAVVTCFFIDCARNVLRFLRIIYTLLEEGGIWINIGPLLWHFENSPTSGKNGEGSIELSLDEVKELARMVGFEIRHEEQLRTTYTGIPHGMLRHEYNAAFWTAVKKTS